MTRKQLKLMNHIMNYEKQYKRLPSIDELEVFCDYRVKPNFIRSLDLEYPEELLISGKEKIVIDLMKQNYNLYEIVEKSEMSYGVVYRIVRKYKPLSENCKIQIYARGDERRNYSVEVAEPLYIEVHSDNPKHKHLNGCRGYATHGSKRAKCTIWKDCKEYCIKLYDTEFTIIEPVNIKLHQARNRRAFILP